MQAIVGHQQYDHDRLMVTLLMGQSRVFSINQITPFLRLGTLVSVEPSLSYFRISDLTFLFGALTLPYCNAVAFMLHAHQGGILVAFGAHLHGNPLLKRT